MRTTPSNTNPAQHSAGSPSPPATLSQGVDALRQAAALRMSATMRQAGPVASATVEMLREGVPRVLHHPWISGKWPALCACLGSIFTIYQQFPFWLYVESTDGAAGINAFGRITASSVNMHMWSDPKILPETQGLHVSGLGGILASVFLVLTIGATLGSIPGKTVRLLDFATLSSVATIVVVVANAVYISQFGNALAGLESRMYDKGGQVAGLVNWFVNSDSILPIPGTDTPTWAGNSSLQPAAYLSMITAICCTFLLLSNRKHYAAGKINFQTLRGLFQRGAVRIVKR